MSVTEGSVPGLRNLRRMAAYETIDLDVRDGVAHLTLNRPDAANGINLELAQDLMDATLAIAADPARGSCCSPAAGKMFCAGGDVKGFADRDDLPTYLRETLGPLHTALTNLVRGDAPVVATVPGARPARAWASSAPPISSWRRSRPSS